MEKYIFNETSKGFKETNTSNRVINKIKIKIMKIDWINSWKSGVKQDDKFCIKVRLGIFTLIEISSDFSQHYLRLIVCNVGLELNKQD